MELTYGKSVTAKLQCAPYDDQMYIRTFTDFKTATSFRRQAPFLKEPLHGWPVNCCQRFSSHGHCCSSRGICWSQVRQLAWAASKAPFSVLAPQ